MTLLPQTFRLVIKLWFDEFDLPKESWIEVEGMTDEGIVRYSSHGPVPISEFPPAVAAWLAALGEEEFPLRLPIA